MKHIIRFFYCGRNVTVAADEVQDALALLCRYDYFDGVDDDESCEWRVLRDDELVTITMEDDPNERERAMPGALWVEDKRTMTAPASSWAATCDEATVTSDSEG